MDSPRGRIHALRAIEKGELTLDATVASHFDSCLGCFACVSACPSGVRYDEILEDTRPKLNSPELRSPKERALRKILFSLLPYPERLRSALRPFSLYPGSKVQKWIRSSNATGIFGPELEAMERLLPPLSRESFKDKWPVVSPAIGPKRGKVGLVLGCVQRVFDPHVNQATVRVLNANGFEVFIPSDQGCCGAVTHHQGELEETKRLAKELIRRFESSPAQGGVVSSEPLDAILVSASGCGHTMKSFGRILQTEEAKKYSAKVKDVNEFLAERGLSDDFQKHLSPLPQKVGERLDPIRVVFHDACHMIHAQGIQSEPRQLLSKIPFLELIEAAESGVCCGSAGIYNLMRPSEADELGRQKVDDLGGTEADFIASANIGCTLQIRRHVLETGRPQSVLHPMELLDLSYSADDRVVNPGKEC